MNNKVSNLNVSARYLLLKFIIYYSVLAASPFIFIANLATENVRVPIILVYLAPLISAVIAPYITLHNHKLIGAPNDLIKGIRIFYLIFLVITSFLFFAFSGPTTFFISIWLICGFLSYYISLSIIRKRFNAKTR